VLFSPPPEPPPSDPALVAPTLYRMSLPGEPGVVRGWLSVSRAWTWDVEGPWWRRRRVRPHLYGEWALNWNEDLDYSVFYAHPDYWNPHSCGLPLDAPDLAEIDRGEFTFSDRVLALEPVDPHDEPDVWRARWDSCAG